ncbi:MAG: papain-like cysteine protease family protein, partial [Patescibacteria group bacterium]
SGYTGHFVVITGFGKNHFTLHDPGLPPLRNRKVSLGRFEKAWAYPNKRAKNIMAFRKEPYVTKS